LGAVSNVLGPAGWSEQPQSSSAARAPQIQLGEAIAEQQLAARGKGSKGTLTSSSTLSLSGMGNVSDPSDRVEQLKRQIDELKSAKDNLEKQPAQLDSDGQAAMRYNQPAPRSSFGAVDARDLGRQLAEKSKEIESRADHATQLASMGRIAEAQSLLTDLEKDEKAVTRDARVRGTTGAGTLVMGGTVQIEGGTINARLGDDQSRLTLGMDSSKPATTDAGTVDLWAKATDLRKAMKFDDAIQVLDRLVAINPHDERALRWREDLSYLQAQSAQVTAGETTRVDTRYLRYPAPSAAPQAVTETRRKLEEARQAVAAKARELATVNFNVEDIAQNKGDEKKLAEFVANNYSWAFNQSRSAVQAGSGQIVTLNNASTYTGGTTISAGTLIIRGMPVQGGWNSQIAASQGQAAHFSDLAANNAGQVTVRATDGALAVTNEATVAGNVNVVLERLRLNMGQSVSVGSRNIFVDERSARAAGVEWKKGANGVAYALVNEGQLLGLMDIEQRASNVAKAVAPQGDVRQDAVVGTPAILANGGVVNIARAADEDNTLSYNGNDIQVTHEDYLLVDNGGYLTAVKSARMHHWTAEAAPVRFPGVPAVVTVPAVGRTVKFEKTLLDASDSMELVADYSWQGDEK
jgi:autotransporter-associated beta strand protein